VVALRVGILDQRHADGRAVAGDDVA
jgi:hypothetical protein